MRASSRFLVFLTVLSGLVSAGPSWAQNAAPAGAEKRIALVVGNAAYQAGALATPANDAGLVAQTLQAAGFDVVGARDLDEDSLRRAMRDFTDKASASGPDTVAFVYLAGYGLQLSGENYFAPIDATIDTAADVPVRAMRVSDYKRQLASLPLKARFLVLDAARNAPFVKRGDPLAGGLALTEAEPGSLVAFNAAPGTVGPDEKGPYGAYAQALVEMIREGGLGPDQLFERVRLRVSETTQGGEVPWNASKLEGSFVFFQRAADAPPIAEPDKVATIESRPLRELPVKDAYASCLKRDTVQGYQDFVTAFPKDPMTKRVRALAAARREAVTWRRSYVADNADAYWSYLSRYPRGPHAFDSRRRLRELSVALEPPPRFTALEYDLPPPPPEEIVYVERPVVYFDDPIYDLPPPPPPPVFFLSPRPAYIVDLGPPPPVYDVYELPVPAFVPVPVYVSTPAYIAAPPNNVYYQNIHNTTVINEINQYNAAPRDARRRPPAGLALGAGAVGGAALGAAAIRVALPPGLARKAALGGNGPGNGAGSGAPVRPGNPALQEPPPNGRQHANKPGQPVAGPNGPSIQGGKPVLGQPLPGQNGQPLPRQANKPDRPVVGPDGKPSPSQAIKPAQPVLGPNGKPLQQQANKPNEPIVGPNGKPLPQLPNNAGAVGQKGANTLADKPGGPKVPDPNDKLTPQQANRVNPATRPDENGKSAGQLGLRPGLSTPPNIGETKPQTPPVRLGNADPQKQPAADHLKQVQEPKQQRGQAAAQGLQAEQAQKQQAAAQRKAAAQQQTGQAATQRQQAVQVQQQQAARAASQQRAAIQQQAAQQRQLMQEQQASQQRAAVQQQAAQQRQMQQQQAAQQRQMMQQQQVAQQRQAQQPSRQPSGNPACRPGMPCR